MRMVRLSGMEFVDGKPLDRMIPKKGMRLNDALKYGIQISSALAAAHKIGIVHRDLKPANVIVTPAGVVKVLDFGLAKIVEAAAIRDDDSTDRVQALTETGIIVGTLSYMSPEQAEGKTVDARSDIFSFGSLLYEMISGEARFGGSRESRRCQPLFRRAETAGEGAARTRQAALAMLEKRSGTAVASYGGRPAGFGGDKGRRVRSIGYRGKKRPGLALASYRRTAHPFRSFGHLSVPPASNRDEAPPSGGSHYKLSWQ